MAMTLASGVTALLESVMRPVRDAFDDCAMTERTGKIIRAASARMQVITSKRMVSLCRAKDGISVRVSRGKRALSAVAGELGRDGGGSISSKPPWKRGKRPQ